MKIDIGTQFSRTPGARFKSDGGFSGEEFRERFLEPQFVTGNEEPIEIVLDGTEGFATSFLEEAFGGLARKVGAERCLRRFSFVSKEDPLLIEEIKSYISSIPSN